MCQMFTTSSRTALGLTDPPIQWLPEALALGVKRPGVKLTTHLHLRPELGTRGALFPPSERLHDAILQHVSRVF